MFIDLSIFRVSYLIMQRANLNVLPAWWQKGWLGWERISSWANISNLGTDITPLSSTAERTAQRRSSQSTSCASERCHGNRRAHPSLRKSVAGREERTAPETWTQRLGGSEEEGEREGDVDASLNLCVFAFLYVMEWWSHEESGAVSQATISLSLSPIPPLTLSPRHLHVTSCCLSPTRPSLTRPCPVTPSAPLLISMLLSVPLPLSLPVPLSTRYKISIRELLTLTFSSIIHPHVGTPVILSAHTCPIILNHSVPENSDNLCKTLFQGTIISPCAHLEFWWHFVAAGAQEANWEVRGNKC